MHHVDRGEQNDRQQDVHGRSGDGDQEAVPAGVIHELPGIVGALIHGILAAHLDVAAEWDGVDAIVGLAAAESDQPSAEADGELLDAHPEPLSHGEVAKLVDQDHEAQDGDDGDKGGQKIRHKGGTDSPTG